MLGKEPKFIIEIEKPIRMRRITGDEDGIFLLRLHNDEVAVREYIYNMLLSAREYLPKNYNFAVDEGFRTVEKQIRYWNAYQEKLLADNPNLKPGKELDEMTDVAVNNPYTHGSGHQTGAAIDIFLCDNHGKPYDMGDDITKFSDDDISATDSQKISDEGKKNRAILKNAMEKVGFVNYPAEYWHYSFGDRLWARLTGSNIAIFAKIT